MAAHRWCCCVFLSLMVASFVLAAAALGGCFAVLTDRRRVGESLLVRRSAHEASGRPPNETNTSTVEMLCSGKPPPKVAICIHGTARTFAHRLVHRSQKENLVNAFWPRATVFAHITRRDARGDPSPGFNALIPESTEAQIRQAAAEVGVEERNIKILEGPSAELPSCSNYQDNYQRRRNATGHVDSMAHLLSLVGQLSHREGCLVLIRKEEVRVGHPFDVVVLVRADITVFVPFKPYCMYNLQRTRRAWDWFFMMPRSAADLVVSQPYNLFYSCTQGFNIGDNVEAYVYPFFREAVEDGHLPVIITRLDQPNFPNNICHRFSNPGAKEFDPEPTGQLCGPMTFKNPSNVPAAAGTVYPPIPQLTCAAFPQTTIAVCAHGRARSFSLPLVHTSIREHLIRAFGANATVFLHLQKDAADVFDKRLRGLLGMLNASMGRVVVHLEVVPLDRRLPPCAAERASSGQGWPAFFDSVYDDLSQRAGCMSLIQKEEQAAKRRFDAVVLVRADAVVYTPMRPFCMYNLRRARRFRDWLFLVPRDNAVELFQRPLECFHGCCLEFNDLKEADTMRFLDPFGQQCVMDESLPVMLVSEEAGETRDRNCTCESFHNLGAMDFDPKPDKLCANLTRGNPYLAREGVS